ncbi:MAG: hypothetical protein JRH11_28025, partial [Deltaproteobacteria bacterium]|nr:hypothetical protein [Deltaproteobacteria bacterium]
MAIVDEQASTHVTGSPVNRGKGAHPGEVLAERYEIVEQLGRDPFVLDHRAIDQETDQPCVLRILEPDLLIGTKAKVVARNVRGAVGIGGSFLPGIKDVDVDDGGRLFIVEPPPEGARLREVLESRTGRGGVLEAREVLPVVARLASAIDAIPAPYHHGDVRLDRVWLSEDGLSLTFPFVMAEVPAAAIAAVTQGHEALTRCLAPELARGLIGGAADRFGVACIVYELLTGELPPSSEGPFPSLAPMGEVGEVISRFLSPIVKDRPANLQALVQAIAKSAGQDVPSLEAGAYRKPNRARRSVTSGLLLPPDELVEPTPMGARRRNRRALVTDTIDELVEDMAESTTKVPPVSAVEAARVLNSASESEGYDDVAFTEKASPRSRGDTDGGAMDYTPLGGPAAVQNKAATSASPKNEPHQRGKLPEGASAEGTQEILAEDLEAVEDQGGDRKVAGEHRRGALPPGAAAGGTQEVLAEDLEAADHQGPYPGANEDGLGASQKAADPLRSTISDSTPPAHEDTPPKPGPERTQQVRAEDILEVTTGPATPSSPGSKSPQESKNAKAGPSTQGPEHAKDGKLGKAIPGAAKEGTQQLRAEDILDARPVADGVADPSPAAAADGPVPLLLAKAKAKLPGAPVAPKGALNPPAERLPPAPRATAAAAPANPPAASA